MKNILLIDDKEEFKEDFKTLSQSKGYRLAYGKSLDDLKEKLPKIHKDIIAVVLDIKCLITNDQKIERPDFIGAALTYLNKEYQELPRLILTGDEKALEGIKQFFNTETEDVFKKTPNDLELLFTRLEEHAINYPTRILTFEEKELLSIIKNDEGKHLEFKASFQFCVKTQVTNKNLRFEVFKNIAAFANSNGGILLIGVEDNKNILGLEETDFKTKNNTTDSYKLLFDDLIESNFGNGFQKNLSDMKFYRTNGKTVCLLNVKGKFEKYVTIKKRPENAKAYDAFYVRGLAGARELLGQEKEDYITAHWSD